MVSMPLAGECCWGLVAEGLVGPLLVVVVSPVFEQDLGFVEAFEGLEVEQFAAEVAVEGFDVGVLPGGSWLDVVGGDAGEAAPLFQGFGDELGAVVAADVLRGPFP